MSKLAFRTLVGGPKVDKGDPGLGFVKCNLHPVDPRSDRRATKRYCNLE